MIHDGLGSNIIYFKMEDPRAKMPTKATENSAGLDLYAIEYMCISSKETVFVPLGFSMSIPEGQFAMVCSRSGMALTSGVFVLNSPGIIDSDYRGEIGVILHNSSDKEFEIQSGKRVAQMVILPYNSKSFLVMTDELPNTERGRGGFGSTGS